MRVSINPYARGLFTGVALIVVGMLLGQASSLVPKNESLGQFFPKAKDLYFASISLAGSETRDLVAVPFGRVFVLTAAIPQLPGIDFRKNGNSLHPFTGIESIWHFNGCSSFRTQHPIQFPFVPGDTLTLVNTTPDGRNVLIWGYWADFN